MSIQGKRLVCLQPGGAHRGNTMKKESVKRKCEREYNIERIKFSFHCSLVLHCALFFTSSHPSIVTFKTQCQRHSIITTPGRVLGICQHHGGIVPIVVCHCHMETYVISIFVSVDSVIRPSIQSNKNGIYFPTSLRDLICGEFTNK